MGNLFDLKLISILLCEKMLHFAMVEGSSETILSLVVTMLETARQELHRTGQMIIFSTKSP